jgi:ferredoxin-NADP reductase
LPDRIVLFYSNRRSEDATFLAELQNLETDNPKYKLIASMIEVKKSHQLWNGETGLTNQEMLGTLAGRRVTHPRGRDRRLLSRSTY